jgi:hypothetical protein
MEFEFSVQPNVRRLAGGWLLLALGALALSTLFAVLLIASRTPWFGSFFTSDDLFGRALVLHVGLAVVVWFMASAAAFWTLASGNAANALRWFALGLSGIGLIAMVLSLFIGAARPVLANYVPVLDHPVFLTGLALFIAGVAFTGAAAAGGMRRRVIEGEAWSFGGLLAVIAAVVALGAWIASRAMADLSVDQARFELLAWGPGHVLQFLHVILLMSVWTILCEKLLGQPAASRRWLRALLVLAAIPLLGVLFIYLAYPVNSIEFRRAFTLLMSFGVWPAAAALALRILFVLKHAKRSVWKQPHAWALFFSAVLFLLGCVLGAMIEADSVMVPAHYHGTVGAVTLAYMAMGYRLLPAFGLQLRNSAMVRWQPLVYGSGLVILALALAWSGSLGVPRKTLHVDVMLQFPAYYAAMGLAGLGGLLAIIGASLFVWNVMNSMRDGRLASVGRSGRRDVRWSALALSLGLTAVVGVLLSYSSTDDGAPVAKSRVNPLQNASGHAAEMRSEEISQRFAKGVELLNTKQFDEAAGELHRVLKLAPQMPEAHVNMGFAMLGLKQYAMARDFFDSAIELNVNQVNAYYGLAVTLEALGDVGGALGAMRSYVHLGKPDDPFLRKANAAIWEWEEALKVSRQAAGAAPPSQAPASQK